MTIIDSIRLFVAINLLAAGSSHLFQPKIWVSFFLKLSKLGASGNILNALMTLAMGSMVLSFHFWWKWPFIIITLYGLLLCTKGILFLLVPKLGLKSIGQVSIEKAYQFRWVGLIMVVGSLLIFYSLIP